MTIQESNKFNDSSSSVTKSAVNDFTGIRVSNDNYSQGVFLFSSRELPRVQNELNDAITKCLKFKPSSDSFRGYHFTIDFFISGKCVSKFHGRNTQWVSELADDILAEMVPTISTIFDIMNKDTITFEVKKNQVIALLKSFRKFVFLRSTDGPVKREVCIRPGDIFILGIILVMIIYSMFYS